MPFLVAILLIAHAGVHVSYLAPRPMATAAGPAWPFDLRRSWILTPLGAPDAATRALGVALVALTLAGFVLAAVMCLGVGPAALWVPAVTIGAIASMATLLLFFHPWLALGLVIDLGLLVAVHMGGWGPVATTLG